MTLDAYLSPTAQNTLFSALITLVGTLVGRMLIARSRIVWGVSHGFVFQVKRDPAQPATMFYTMTVVVQNVGRAPATEVEVHFNFTPEHFQIWPTLVYDMVTNPEGRFTIKIGNLGKREYFTLELLSTNALPEVLRVRSPNGDAKKVPMAPRQVFPAWVNRSLFALLILGLFSIVQNLFFLLR